MKDEAGTIATADDEITRGTQAPAAPVVTAIDSTNDNTPALVWNDVNGAAYFIGESAAAADDR